MRSIVWRDIEDFPEAKELLGAIPNVTVGRYMPTFDDNGQAMPPPLVRFIRQMDEPSKRRFAAFVQKLLALRGPSDVGFLGYELPRAFVAAAEAKQLPPLDEAIRQRSKERARQAERLRRAEAAVKALHVQMDEVRAAARGFVLRPGGVVERAYRDRNHRLHEAAVRYATRRIDAVLYEDGWIGRWRQRVTIDAQRRRRRLERERQQLQRLRAPEAYHGRRLELAHQADLPRQQLARWELATEELAALLPDPVRCAKDPRDRERVRHRRPTIMIEAEPMPAADRCDIGIPSRRAPAHCRLRSSRFGECVVEIVPASHSLGPPRPPTSFYVRLDRRDLNWWWVGDDGTIAIEDFGVVHNETTRLVWRLKQAVARLTEAQDRVVEAYWAACRRHDIQSRPVYWEGNRLLEKSNQILVRNDWTGRLEWHGPPDRVVGRVARGYVDAVRRITAVLRQREA